jgi:hypothetical protein
MNFTFSDNEKKLFQELESTLTHEKKKFVQGTLHTEKDIAQALITLKHKLTSSGYFNAFNDSASMGATATLEMMRIFARHFSALFLGVEYGFRIFAEMSNCLTESFIQSLQIDDTIIPCAIAFCEDFVETDTNPSSINIQFVDDHFLLSGEKSFVINAGIAKWIAVNAHIDGREAIFFISRYSEGLEIRPHGNKRIFPELAIANIALKNCPVPKDNLIYPEQMNIFVSQIQLFENLACIACALGMIDQCMETTTRFAKTHQSENKPLIAHQAVAFSLAEAVTLRQTAELLAYRATWMVTKDDSEKFVMTQCAKVFCTESAETIASQCMNILGGQVFLENHMVEQMLFNSKFIQLLGTSTHLARIAIADVLL